MIRPWRTLARRVLVQQRPPWFEVGEQDEELTDRKTIEGFTWIDERPFAIIVPLRADGSPPCSFARTSTGVRDVALSIPAGFIEDGAPPIEAAQRELREESGYAADDWTPLGRYAVDGNYGAGTMHAVLARGARKVCEPDGGDLEEQEVVVVPWADAVERQRGEVKQLSTAAALAALALD